MQATLHQIKHRRDEDVKLSSPDDFTLTAPRRVQADIVLTDPNLTLYCLDLRTQHALFVRTPAGVDLYDAPFMYQRQRATAQEVLAVPLETLSRLSEQASARFDKLSFLFSVGRCGSSTMAKLLNQLPGVRCVCEPDVLSQLVVASDVPPFRAPAERTRLLRVCLPFCLPVARPHAPHVIVKPRGYVLQLLPPLWQAFPALRAVLLSRDPEPMVGSFLRMLDSRAGSWLPRGPSALKLALALQSADERAAMHKMVPIFDQIPMQRWTSIGVGGLLLANWVSMQNTYRKVRAQGLPIELSKYEDFLASPQTTILCLLTALGVHTDGLDVALNTALAGVRSSAREARGPLLSDKERAGLHEILRIVSPIDVPDVRHA